MDKRSLLFMALVLALASRCGSALADESDDRRPASGIHEVADDELADMRGRYVAGNNTVLWFGVEMISTWQSSNGQTLQSTLTVGMDFSKNPNQPQVKFVPTVTITTIGNALPASTTASNISRSVQSAGLANVSGLTQSVQIAGDNNAASNVTSLDIQSAGSAPTAGNSNAPAPASVSSPNPNSTPSTASVDVTGSTVNASSSTGHSGSASAPPTSSGANVAINDTAPTVSTNTGTSTATGRTARVGDASASSTYANNSAEVALSINGQGSVSQWIRQGSLGQTIALTTDNQVATNQMIVTMVTQSVNASTSQLAHNLAQSLNLNRSNR